jgi:hypothetical protein
VEAAYLPEPAYVVPVLVVPSKDHARTVPYPAVVVTVPDRDPFRDDRELESDAGIESDTRDTVTYKRDAVTDDR